MHITKENINEFTYGDTMYCSGKGITHIEYIPDGITGLDCHNNQLTKLPKLPDGLIRLNCYVNKLTELPKLPESLTRLFCYVNNLTELPKLPDGLIHLDCENNELTSLPNDLKFFYCHSNNLPYIVTIKNLKQHNQLIKRKEILKQICG